MTPRLLHDLVDDRARHTPDAPALRHAEAGWTYRELAEWSSAVAAWLAGHGVAPGDRVLVIAPNTAATVALVYGSSRIGAGYVVVSDRTKEFHLGHIIADSVPALVVTTAELATPVARLADCPVACLDELPPARAAGTPPEVDVAPGELASLIYTSGSTAKPKAVVSTHRQVLFAADAIQRRLRYRPGDRVFCCLPLSFDYGLYQLFLCARAGACLVLGTDDDAGPALLPVLERHGVSVLPLVPGVAATLTRLARRAGRLPERLRMVTNTGAALPPAASAALRAHRPGLDVVPMYGLTECKRVSIEAPNADLVRPGSVGRPLPGTAVAVVDDAGEPLPTGHTGELVVRGPHVMAGYWRAPGLTRERFRRDDRGRVVLHTGDRCRLDEQGHLYFAGRDDDIYKQHGFRVSAVEVECAAADIEGVQEAALALPTADRDAALAVVGTPDPSRLRKELGARLEEHKVPDIIRVLPSLPHTVHGKIDKQALGERL